MNEVTEPLRITLDIAATLSAILWPVVVVVVLYLLREEFPALLKELGGRVTKLDIAGITLEFAKAKPFAPEYASPTAGIDLRQRASAMQVNDSTAGTFISQLRDPIAADYAIVDLGGGDQWLTSRLYIMAVIFARMKGVRAFVFLGQAGLGRRYLGWADPDRIRWALGRRYPWLEAAYATAYAEVAGTSNANAVVTSPTGRLGYRNDPADPGASVALLSMFLRQIEWPQDPTAPAPVAPWLAPSPSPNAPDWVLINEVSQTWEHATWLTATLLEEILGEELNFSHVALDALQGEPRSKQIRHVLARTGRYVAVVQEELRFEYLIDRSLLLEQVAQALSSDAARTQGD
jgi:hypothetical protein